MEEEKQISELEWLEPVDITRCVDCEHFWENCPDLPKPLKEQAE